MPAVKPAAAPAEAPAPPAEAPPAEEAPVPEAVPEAPAAPTVPAKTWKAADKPRLDKFPPTEPPVKLDIEDETSLSRDQLKILREAFKIFDSDGKGAIKLDMVKEILTLLGHEVDDEELDEVMEEFDEDDSGEIEFSEFIKLAEEFVEPEQDIITVKAELKEIFMMYDKDQKGFIPVETFKSILKELDNELADEEAEAMVKELDTDGSGTIEFEEFIDAMIGDDEL